MHRGPEIASQRLRGALEVPIGPNLVLYAGRRSLAVRRRRLSTAPGAPKAGARLACLAAPA